MIKSPSIELKELGAGDSEVNQQRHENQDNNEDEGEERTETAEEASEFPVNTESFTESDDTPNLNDDEVDLANMEKTRPEVSLLITR